MLVGWVWVQGLGNSKGGEAIGTALQALSSSFPRHVSLH